METKEFTIERTYNAPVKVVWEAITKKHQMKEWYFDIEKFEAKVGFEFTFEGGPPEKTYVHLCKVVEVIVMKKLSYTWVYEGYEGSSIVTFELFEEGNKTRLILTHTGIDTFPKSNKDLVKENFVAGWTELIGKLLKNYVENKPRNFG